MIPITQTTRKKNNSTSKAQNLDVDYADDEGFIEGDIDTGKVFSTFSFGMSDAPSNDKPSTPQTPMEDKKYEIPNTQNLTFAEAPRGLTPPVNGELYTVKRCYQFRQSTIRKLNELKANHTDINVYLNTIIDEAISYYYDFVFNSKGN